MAPLAKETVVDRSMKLTLTMLAAVCVMWVAHGRQSLITTVSAQTFDVASVRPNTSTDGIVNIPPTPHCSRGSRQRTPPAPLMSGVRHRRGVDARRNLDAVLRPYLQKPT